MELEQKNAPFPRIHMDSKGQKKETPLPQNNLSLNHLLNPAALHLFSQYYLRWVISLRKEIPSTAYLHCNMLTPYI